MDLAILNTEVHQQVEVGGGAQSGSPASPGSADRIRKHLRGNNKNIHVYTNENDRDEVGVQMRKHKEDVGNGEPTQAMIFEDVEAFSTLGNALKTGLLWAAGRLS